MILLPHPRRHRSASGRQCRRAKLTLTSFAISPVKSSNKSYRNGAMRLRLHATKSTLCLRNARSSDEVRRRRSKKLRRPSDKDWRFSTLRLALVLRDKLLVQLPQVQAAPVVAAVVVQRIIQPLNPCHAWSSISQTIPSCAQTASTRPRSACLPST